MIEALAHRGPDGRFVWCEGSVSLARAVSNTTIGSHLTPTLHVDGAIVVTGDLRLDEREALAVHLQLKADEVSDLELLCAAYRRWGEDCPLHLVGDFAFALWDRRDRKLFCARDHFGVRPFYYHLSRDWFAFGSEIKAVLASGVAEFSPREAGIGEYLASAPADPEKTFYEDIHPLRPAHRITIDDDGPRIERYWSLTLDETKASRRPVEEFVEVFDRAVTRRTRSTKPVGAFLSGGLDSSSIVRMAAPRAVAETGQPLVTLSAVFDKTPQWSERQYIESVLTKGDCAPEILSADNYAPFQDLDQMIAAQDGPFFTPGMALTRQLYAVARQRNLSVLLDGHGGDETVSHGYGRLTDLARARNWPKLWEQIKGVAHIYGESDRAAFIHYFLQYGPLRRPVLAARRVMHRLRPPAATTDQPFDWTQFVNRDFAERMRVEERRAELSPPRQGGEKAEHLADLLSPNTAAAFETLGRQAAADGMEIRYPFWDRDLVELCLNLPSDQKLDGGWTRLILRRAMEGRLPSDVQWRRSKLDFKAHLIRGMLNHHATLLEGVVFEDSGKVGDYLNLPALGDAYRRMQQLREDVPPIDMFSIYRAVMLSEWHRKHLLRI